MQHSACIWAGLRSESRLTREASSTTDVRRDKQADSMHQGHPGGYAVRMHVTGCRVQPCGAHPSGVGGYEQGQDSCEDTDARYQEEGKAPSVHPQQVPVPHTCSKEAACHATYVARIRVCW